jgi:hypothetical protein
MKSVCVIGAGPAGLVATKVLAETGGFAVTIYEAADRVGGMWRAEPGEEGEKCSPDMRTNLSRFTVAFSDLSWRSVDLTDPTTGAPACSTPPMFPRAWQVGRYLHEYANKFNIMSKVMLNKTVTQVERLETSEAWVVSLMDTVTMKEYTRSYDFLIVASGFFDSPNRSLDPSPNKDSDNFLHSSQFRNLTELSHKVGKIVVVGGGISGAEAAAQAAFQISNAKHAQSGARNPHSDSTVYHVINRSFHCLPRYLPQVPAVPGAATNVAPTFLPLDLVLYNLSRRTEDDISASITTVPPEKASKAHAFLQMVIGGQHSLGGLSNSLPAYTAITDTYSEFVRSGLIVPIEGWVEVVEPDNDGGFVVTCRARKAFGAACSEQVLSSSHHHD